MSRLAHAGLLIVVALGAGAAGYGVRGGSPARVPAVKPGPPPAPPPLAVQAVRLEPVVLTERVTATGTLRPAESVELQAETSGKVTAIHFTEGSRVRRGDLLLKINDAELRASLSRAVFRRELAAVRERRLATLLDKGGVNQQDYDNAVNELNVQRAEVDLIEAQIAKTEVRAPFDGVVGLRFVSPGAYVTPAARIATLQDVSSLKLDFTLPEKYAPRVRLGAPLAFTLAGEGASFPGEVYALEPRIDAATRTLLLRARVGNPGERLQPGAFANVEFTLAEVGDALLVPASAVIPGLVDKNVFVIEQGRAALRTVVTGTRTEKAVQVVEGLRAGEIVITSGLQQMRAGQPVVPRLEGG